MERKPIHDISELEIDTSREFKFAIIAHEMMHGLEIDDQWLKIEKNNDQKSDNDDNKFAVDFKITLSGQTIGFLDVEEKQKWEDGEWPYPKTNIAKYPMNHWKKQKFKNRETNKIKAFKKKPEASFWVGCRKDWQSCHIIHWPQMLKHGREKLQMTGYSKEPLPVYQCNSIYGANINNPQQLTQYITQCIQTPYQTELF